MFADKMKNKTEKNHTVRTVSKSNLKIVTRGTIETSNNIYMTVHFPSLLHALQ